MQRVFSFLLLLFLPCDPAVAGPVVREDVFGKSLGGWKSRDGKAADYEISGVSYRSWRPHVTPTVDGGVFVSLRIDHRRGFLASDDHASLELTFSREGEIVSAQSTIALQGRKITSDVITGGTKLGTSVSGVDKMVKVGTDLVASLTSKLLREKITEPGRVGFPAAVRHNYNLLCMAIVPAVQKAVPVGEEGAEEGEPAEPLPVAPTAADADEAKEPQPEETEGGEKTKETEGMEESPTSAPDLEIREQGKPPEKSTTKEELPK